MTVSMHKTFHTYISASIGALVAISFYSSVYAAAPAAPAAPAAVTPVPVPATIPAATSTPVAATADAVAESTDDLSLNPTIADIPSTFTFRASCIKKTYVDGFYKKQLNEPKLVSNGKSIYTLYATCLNGLGVPVNTKIKLKLVVRNISDIRTISIRSIIDHSRRYRNCADISNQNGIIACIPAHKPKKGHKKK